jgi:hypothetical protein
MSGDMNDCPLFEYFDDATRQDCYVPRWVNEQTTGILDSLPGCNPVQNGPATATPKSGCGATTTVGPPILPYQDMAKSGWSYAGCAKDLIGNVRTLPYAFRTSKINANTMTNEDCIAGCESKGYTYAGTEYAGDCWCGNSVSQEAAPIPGIMGSCTMACKGDPNQICGGSKRMSLYKKCSPGENCINARIPTLP